MVRKTLAILLMLLCSSPSTVSATPKTKTYTLAKLGVTITLPVVWRVTLNKNGGLSALNNMTSLLVVPTTETSFAKAQTRFKSTKRVTYKRQPPLTVNGRKATAWETSTSKDGLKVAGLVVLFQPAKGKLAIFTAGGLGKYSKGFDNQLKSILATVRTIDKAKRPKPAKPTKPAKPAKPAGLSKGDAIVDFTLPHLDGAKVALSTLRQKVIVLVFWSTWASPSKMWLKRLAEDKTLASNSKVAMLFPAWVDRRNRSRLKPYVRSHSIALKSVLVDMDAKVLRQWNPARKVPSVYVIRGGKVARAFTSGYSDAQHKELRKLVKSLLK